MPYVYAKLRMPCAQHQTPRVNSTNREPGSLVFHIGTCHLRVHSHERSERETGPEPGNRSKIGFIAGNILKAPPPDQPAAAEPKPPSPSNLEDTMEAGARFGACTPTGSSSQHMHKPCYLSLWPPLRPRQTLGRAAPRPSQGPTKSTGRC